MAPSEYSTRWTEQRGKRPVRIANCSGYKADPGYHMRYQAELGDVDFITGDYLAEVNIAENAQAHAAGNHPGWEKTAWDGIEQTVDLLSEKKIKVIVNGGAHNPKGLAEKVQELVTSKGYNLKVAYVLGDNLFEEMKDIREKGLPPHLDSDNSEVTVADHALDLVEKGDKPIVSANAYLGAREIVKGLEQGADIVIAGRVADASPVIGAAWYWHSWHDTDYDELAGALIAGHLIECSGYVTGSNFAGFYEYPLDDLYDITFGIAEVESDGTCVITKHDAKNGFVTEDTVKCQFLYELQGNIYLNSDVKAILDNVQVKAEGHNRIRLWGIKGAPPPPTTKLAIFYQAGYQSEIVVNATGYGTQEKFELWERMIKFGLKRQGLLDQFDILEFQRIGVPEHNPRSQLRSTSYCRIFAEASDANANLGLASLLGEFAMQHYSGFHSTADHRTAVPKPYISYFPAIYPQSSLTTSINILEPTKSPNSPQSNSIRTTPPPKFEELAKRQSYETSNPVSLISLGPTTRARLGDIVLARSGDKGGNANIGFFIPTALPSSYPPSSPLYTEAWDWLRTFLTISKIKHMFGESWSDKFHVERVEFPKIYAVHFVVYGVLGRGVSGSSRLDSFAKGMGDWLRDVVVDVPVKFIDGRQRRAHAGTYAASGVNGHRL
ncbi:Nn.00g072850.m01.CDS01 [Neocucurbitaria sp. VM-36]